MVEEPAPHRRIAAAFYFLLIVLGIFYYVAWGIVYNSWNLAAPENMGVYALTVVMIGFGVTGYLLYRKPVAKAGP